MLRKLSAVELSYKWKIMYHRELSNHFTYYFYFLEVIRFTEMGFIPSSITSLVDVKTFLLKDIQLSNLQRSFCTIVLSDRRC